MKSRLFTQLQYLLTLRVTQAQIEKWSRETKIFFILAQGRSGTAFLADLLNQSQNSHVCHEPVFEDLNAYVKAYYSPQAAENYMQRFRKKEIYLRMWHIPTSVYGEVNSILRRHANAIKSAFPDATLIHLVRDGREVVRSMISRTTMTEKDRISTKIHPVKSDPWRNQWDQMDRFSRLCWYWQTENAYLRTTLNKTVQFDKILANYDYFHNEILRPCHIDIGQEIWARAIASPRNATDMYHMPKWADWTSEQQEIFKNICGDEMVKSGYVF